MVIAYRSRGYSWTDVTLHFGLSPEIFYVPVREVYGPPYGRAYGYYKHKPRKEWRRIVLDDREVVDLVNLRVISEHYGYAPEEIMRRRAAGLDFVIINDELHSKKERKELEKERRKEDKALEREWKDEGKGHPPGRGDERERR